MNKPRMSFTQPCASKTHADPTTTDSPPTCANSLSHMKSLTKWISIPIMTPMVKPTGTLAAMSKSPWSAPAWTLRIIMKERTWIRWSVRHGGSWRICWGIKNNTYYLTNAFLKINDLLWCSKQINKLEKPQLSHHNKLIYLILRTGFLFHLEKQDQYYNFCERQHT